ncbi:MAG: peroxidase, partial [Acidimicrobiales bacterium]
MSTGVQEGIYFDKGAQPGRFFNLAFLRASPECTAATVRAIVGQLWAALQGLKRGEVIALPGRPVPVADHRLSVLVGYGVKAFSLAGVVRAAPAGLGPEFHFRSALPAGGGALLRGSGLSYAADIKQNPGTEEIVLQFIADSQLAVHRCVVETWKILHAHTDAGTGSAPLNLAAVFSGFQRDDGRSWIDFHDGVSNLISGDERRGILAVKAENAPEPADAWTGDGSYLAFLRLAVDLAAWQRLSRTEQELLVGRDKL